MQLGEKEERTRARPAHIWCPTHPTAGDKRATRSLVGVTDRQTRWGAHTPHTTTPTARIGFFSLSLSLFSPVPLSLTIRVHRPHIVKDRYRLGSLVGRGLGQGLDDQGAGGGAGGGRRHMV